MNFLSTSRQLFEANDIPLETKIDFFKEITSSKDFYRANFFQINNLISDLAIKNPNDFRITQLYGNHLISSGNLEGALQLYKSHVTDSAPQREVFTEILDMESYLKHPDSVAKYTTLALEKFPSDPEFYLRKGFGMFYFMEDYAGAEKEFLKALKLTRTDSLRSVIYGTLGDNRQKMEDGPGAYGYYRKGLKYDPDNSMILNNYSYYLSEKDEKLSLADKMSEKACELSPNNPTYLDTRAWVLFKLGRYEEAKTLMQQALALASYAREQINRIAGFACMGTEVAGQAGIAGLDTTRLVITAKKLGLTGFDLEECLFQKYTVNMELADYENVLAIVTYANTREEIDRLISACRSISQKLLSDTCVINRNWKETHNQEIPCQPQQVMTPRQAYFAQTQRIPWEQAVGRIAGEMVAPYPPGIPILYAGERITQEVWEYLERFRQDSRHMHGIEDGQITVMKAVSDE